MPPTDPAALFILLVFGHFVADYPLQTDFIARGKSPRADPQYVPWYYVLTAHAATHGFFVALLTGDAWLGVAKTVAHMFIDFGKCLGMTNIHVDQAMHIFCKVMWVFLVKYA